MIARNEALCIAELFYLLDKGVRNDLHENRIADERDCVSRLVTHFNYPFGLFNNYGFENLKLKSKWFAKVNSGHHERKFGCDSMIVFKVNDKIKVGLFEAKWPRVILDPNYNWDSIQKSTKTSHFTDQINRQAKWANQAAIWEMFFYEEKVGTLNEPFDRNASTCIRHQFAKNLVDTKPGLQTLWNNTDLTTLIQSEQTEFFNGSNETNIRQIIFDILTCKFGKAIDIKPKDRTFTLNSKANKENARCPIISMTGENETDQIAENFMYEYGLSFFQQLNIDVQQDTKEVVQSSKI